MKNYIGLIQKNAGLIFRLLYFLITTLVLFGLHQNWSYDDPYITYRYANNILSGSGFVYNLGEQTLSTTTPLFTILLVLLRWLLPDLPQLAVLIGSASLAAGGLVLFQLAHEYRSSLIGKVFLLLYPIFPLTIQTLGSETPLYIALLLGSILAYVRKKYILVAFLLGLLVLTRPDGLLLPALLGIHFLLFERGRQPFPWKAILVFAVLNVAWFGFAWLYFGSPLTTTLAAKQQQGLMAISERFLPGLITTAKGYVPSWGYRLEGGLMVLGIGLIFMQRRWLLLIAWTIAYLAAYSLLGVTRYFWYYAPLVPGFMVAVSAGFNLLWELRLRLVANWARKAFSGAVLILFIFVSLTQLVDLFRDFQDDRIPVYTEIGTWLNANTAPGASVAALEVGAIGFFAQRKMIDFSGLIQPDISRQLTRDTTYEDAALYAVAQYRPDYVIINTGGFPKLRAGPIAENCGLLKTFQNGKISLDLFACDWK